MSSDNRYNRYTDRDINVSGNDQLTITRTFNDRGRFHNSRNWNREGGRGRGRFNGRGNTGDRSNGPKKLPSNMVERKEEYMHAQVKLAQKIIIKLCDYTDMDTETEIAQNIKDLANMFLNLGDLQEHGNDIADVFVKCFSQLSVQSPIIASLLSLIHIKEQQSDSTSDAVKFSTLVLEKLQAKLSDMIAQDNIPVIKLLLRAVACLAAAGTWAIDGDGGLVEILRTLLDIGMDGAESADEFVSRVQNSQGLFFAYQPSTAAQSSLYILSSSLPWLVKVLSNNDACIDILSEIRNVLVIIRRCYRSPYAIGGIQAIWQSQAASTGDDAMMDSDECVHDSVLISPGPATVFSKSSDAPAANCGAYDSLWEACHMALLAIGTDNDSIDELPGCFVRPWEQFAANGLLPAAPGVPIGNIEPKDQFPPNSDSEIAVSGNDDATMEGGDEEMVDNFAVGMELPQQQLRFSEEFVNVFKRRINPSEHSYIGDVSSSGIADSDMDGDGALSVLGSKAECCIVDQVRGMATSAIGSTASCQWLRARFSLIDDDVHEDAQICCRSLSALEKCAAFTFLQDVLEFFEPIVNEDGTMLGSMELLTKHLLAVFKLFPENSQMEYLLMEMLMQIILQQPINEPLNAKVFRLILELCRQQPTKFPPVVALAVNVVFQMIGQLDFCGVKEFSRWFSFHLVNTQLLWPFWNFWLSELQSEQEILNGNKGPIELFIRQVMVFCSSAVEVDRLRSTFPEELHSFFETDTAPVCCLLPAVAINGDKQMIISNETEAIAAVEDEGAVATSLLGHISHIASAAKILRNKIQVDRIDADDLCDYLESLKHPCQFLPGTSEAIAEASEISSLCWRGSLLLHVLLDIGGRVAPLSGIVSLLDKYSITITTLAASEEDQMDLLNMLFEVYGHNSEMFKFCLDEMVRRQQVRVAVLTRWLCSKCSQLSMGANSGNLNESICFSCLEIMTDRAADIVRGAVGQRLQFGSGDDFVLDMSLNLVPTPEPERMMKSNGTDTDMESGTKRKKRRNEEDEEDENDDEGRRKRVRRDEDTGAVNATAGNDDEASEGDADIDDEDSVDPVWAAGETVKAAFSASRSGYQLIIEALVQTIENQCQQTSNHSTQVQVQIWSSLLRRVLRCFHGLERSLTVEYSRPVIATATASSIRSLLKRVTKALNSVSSKSFWDDQYWSNVLHLPNQ